MNLPSQGLVERVQQRIIPLGSSELSLFEITQTDGRLLCSEIGREEVEKE